MESGNNTVDVTLTYTDANGGTKQETRRLYLEQGAAGYLISDDAAIGG